MSSRLILLTLLAGCLPKTGTTTEVVPTPVTPAPAPVEEPAPAPVVVPTADPTGAAAAAPAEVPATPPSAAIAAKDVLARKVNDAVANLTTGDPSRAQRAIEILQSELGEHPDVGAIHYNIGVAQRILGNEAEARKAWTRATEVDPTFAKAWVNLGALSAASGRLDLALSSFQSGTRYNPQSIELRVAAIDALRQLGRFDDAVAEAKAALFINSKAISVYTELAMVYLDTGKYDLARFTLQKALADIEGAKSSARLHAVLGEVYYRLGYSGDAVQSFQKSLELDPFQLPALLYLAGYHLDNRSWSDATPLLERAVKIAPKDAGVQLNLGISFRGEGRLEDAKAAYMEALRLQPSNPEPHRNLAVLYGDYMKAYDAAIQSIEDYRRGGGGPAAELEEWIASIRKEQKRIEDARVRAEKRKKQEQAEKAEQPAEGLFGGDQPVDGGAVGVQPDPGGVPPQPAPEPAPQPAPEPVPAGDDGSNPWGG